MWFLSHNIALHFVYTCHAVAYLFTSICAHEVTSDVYLSSWSGRITLLNLWAQFSAHIIFFLSMLPHVCITCNRAITVHSCLVCCSIALWLALVVRVCCDSQVHVSCDFNIVFLRFLSCISLEYLNLIYNFYCSYIFVFPL